LAGSLNSLAQLGRSRSRANALFSKRTSQFLAFINTAEAFTKALTLGPIIGPIAAAGISIAGGAQVAAIEAQKLGTGGEVGGSSRNDIVPAFLTPGEHVIRKEQVIASGGHENIDRLLEQGGASQNITLSFMGTGDEMDELIKILLPRLEMKMERV